MTAEPTSLVLACATIAAVIIAISIAALAADCFCWFRQMREKSARFKGRDLMHNEPAVQDLIRRAVAADRSLRSRKGWQTRKEAAKAQQDRDIQTLLAMPTEARDDHR